MDIQRIVDKLSKSALDAYEGNYRDVTADREEIQALLQERAELLLAKWESADKIEYLTKRSEEIASICVTSVVGVLANYTQAHSEFGSVTPMTEVMDDIEDDIRESIVRFGCPQDQARLQHFDMMLSKIEAGKVDILRTALLSIKSSVDGLQISRSENDTITTIVGNSWKETIKDLIGGRIEVALADIEAEPAE